MYRFLLRPKWIVFHVVVIAAVIGMLNLARWQWDKHVARDEFKELVDERRDAEPQPLLPLPRAPARASCWAWALAIRRPKNPVGAGASPPPPSRAVVVIVVPRSLASASRLRASSV